MPHLYYFIHFLSFPWKEKTLFFVIIFLLPFLHLKLQSWYFIFFAFHFENIEWHKLSIVLLTLSNKPLPFCLLFVLFFLIFYFFLFCIFSSWIWSHYLFSDLFFLYFPIFRAQKLRPAVQGSQEEIEIASVGDFSPFCILFLLPLICSIHFLISGRDSLFKYLILVLLYFILSLEGKIINLLFLLPSFLYYSLYS